mmetsp:Transcript_19544/g.59112  ORF Transcript_19544/g.59112 Transcript_19544/m.59112 type:complete len:221 (-) Transcript_19544:75-737(-)
MLQRSLTWTPESAKCFMGERGTCMRCFLRGITGAGTPGRGSCVQATEAPWTRWPPRSCRMASTWRSRRAPPRAWALCGPGTANRTWAAPTAAAASCTRCCCAPPPPPRNRRRPLPSWRPRPCHRQDGGRSPCPLGRCPCPGSPSPPSHRHRQGRPPPLSPGPRCRLSRSRCQLPRGRRRRWPPPWSRSCRTCGAPRCPPSCTCSSPLATCPPPSATSLTS